MKKYTFLFTVILILLFNTSTHTQWFQQNSGTTHNLFNVYFVNQNMGWVTVNYENSGTSYNSILATNNGGLNWFNQYSYSIGKTDYITSIFFLNETSGFYTEVTYYPEWIQSQIFSTMNGGFGWSNIFNDIGLNLNSIFFINQNTGWAVGSDGQKYTNTTGKILKSTDGGISWSFLPDLPNNYLEEVFFINQSTGWIASLGGIYKTTNGGYNWFINYNNNNFAVSDVKFKDQNIGWAVGYEGVCNSGSTRTCACACFPSVP